MRKMNRIPVLLFAATGAFAQTQRQPPTPSQSINSQFNYVNQKVLEMAQDFPADKYDRLDPKDYKTKADVVAVLQKSINEATATPKAIPEERFTKTLSPWPSVIEHGAEHYGQLVVYYRLNGMIPPESRPKAKTN